MNEIEHEIALALGWTEVEHKSPTGGTYYIINDPDGKQAASVTKKAGWDWAWRDARDKLFVQHPKDWSSDIRDALQLPLQNDETLEISFHGSKTIYVQLITWDREGYEIGRIQREVKPDECAFEREEQLARAICEVWLEKQKLAVT